jgi:probable addiction module antidote protein
MKKVPAAVPHEEHSDEILKDAEQAAAYLNVAIEGNDPQQVLKAVRNVARAHGISDIAEVLHMQRESVSRMLSKNGNPGLSNFLKILDAAGLVIQVKPKGSGHHRRTKQALAA